MYSNVKFAFHEMLRGAVILYGVHNGGGSELMNAHAQCLMRARWVKLLLLKQYVSYPQPRVRGCWACARRAMTSHCLLCLEHCGWTALPDDKSWWLVQRATAKWEERHIPCCILPFLAFDEILRLHCGSSRMRVDVCVGVSAAVADIIRGNTYRTRSSSLGKRGGMKRSSPDK
jgi:hypothetical protein